jgi:hypothetical protein
MNMNKLIKIQKELKAPKGQFNKFGNYKYRSCEDILEAVKPLCAEEGVQLTISDEIVMIGDRYYVKATATVTDGSEAASVTAYAREEETKKGMDSSQITGATSSYARKYALNGLFCIDDTKDADTDEFTEKTRGSEKKKSSPKSNELTYREKLIIYLKESGLSFAEVAKDYGLNGSTTEERFAEVLKDLEGK